MKNQTLSRNLGRIALIATLSLTAVSTEAKTYIYPLTENTWSNPEFVNRFVGTYGFDLNINPKIIKEEADLFQSVAPLMQSQTTQAIRMIETYIQTVEASENPEYSAAVDYTLGSLYLQSQNIPVALEKYRLAIKKFPNFYRAYQNLGLALVQSGDHQGALQYLTKAIEIGGGNSTLFGLTGFCFLNTERPSLALQAYNQALIFQPESRDWALGKLSALQATNQTAEAIAMLDEMIEANPLNADFWLQQANAFMGTSAYVDALANLELVARMGKGNGRSQLLLGDLYVNEGLERIGVDHYVAAMETEEISADRLLRVVESLSARNVPTEASRFLTALNDKFSGTWSPEQELSALNLSARISLSMGDRDKAAATLQKIVSMDPLNGKALISLGDFQRDANELEMAEMRYSQALEDESVRFEALIALARLKVSQREYRAALDYLKRAQSIDARSYIADYIAQLEAALRSMNS